MSEYAVYQITCSYKCTKEEFEKGVGLLLAANRTLTKVSVTVNSIVHSSCLYSLQAGGFESEPCAMLIVSINPNHIPKDGVPAVRDALPFVKWLAEKLRVLHDQHVVPYSAISLASTVTSARCATPATQSSQLTFTTMATTVVCRASMSSKTTITLFHGSEAGVSILLALLERTFQKAVSGRDRVLDSRNLFALQFGYFPHLSVIRLKSVDERFYRIKGISHLCKVIFG